MGAHSKRRGSWGPDGATAALASEDTVIDTTATTAFPTSSMPPPVSTEAPTAAVEPPTAAIEASTPEPTGKPAATSGSLVDAAPAVRIRAIFQRFWPDTSGFRGRLVFSLALIALPPGLAAAGIWLFKILVDEVLTTRDVARFPMIAAAFLAVTLLEGVVSFVDQYLSSWVAERFVMNLRCRVFAHLQQLSLTFFEQRQLGDILARLTGDVNAIEQLLLSGVSRALTYIFQVIFFAGALFVLDWRLAVAALIAAPGFLLLARFFARRIKKASRERRRRSGTINAVAEESLHNAALVQAYHRQAHETAKFRAENLGSFAAQMVATKLEALFHPFSDLLEATGVLLVIGFGLRELASGQITLGGLLVFIGYLTQLYGPITGFGDLTNTIFAASAGAERVIEVLDTEPEVRDPDEPIALGRARGAVRVDQVGFGYDGGDRPALDGVSFRAAPGETIAVVGASGAGKSTLLRMLLRLHDPHRGSVTLDGVDLRRLRLGELRGNIAVVLQETLVFDGTIAENIRWGKPDATDDEMLRAARTADAHEFIAGFPDGYQTRVGQRGMMLSGGQRQRIALARAMIRNAPVLVLDEPTTGLDAASTQRVMAPLRRAMAGRTTIVISHNLLTVTEASRIVYMERGRVVGYGTHSELLARCHGYAELYRLHHPEPGQLAPRPRPRPDVAAARSPRPEVAAVRSPRPPAPAVPPKPDLGTPIAEPRPLTPVVMPAAALARLSTPGIEPPRVARPTANITARPTPSNPETREATPMINPPPSAPLSGPGPSSPSPDPRRHAAPPPPPEPPRQSPQPTPSPRPHPTPHPRPRPTPHPRPRPTPFPRSRPEPQPHPAQHVRPLPARRQWLRPLPIPRPRPVATGAFPLPIPTQRPAPAPPPHPTSDARPSLPRWSGGKPFDNDAKPAE
jgi:ATP-binding cassette, subfamily B, bacterial